MVNLIALFIPSPPVGFFPIFILYTNKFSTSVTHHLLSFISWLPDSSGFVVSSPELPSGLGNYIFKQPWVWEGRVDFSLAGKKNLDSMFICTKLNIVVTNATLWHAHLTTHLKLILKYAIPIAALLLETALIKTIIPLSKELSIVFHTVSKKYYRVKE
jgi:hypothetical protein